MLPKHLFLVMQTSSSISIRSNQITDCALLSMNEHYRRIDTLHSMISDIASDEYRREVSGTDMDISNGIPFESYLILLLSKIRLVARNKGKIYVHGLDELIDNITVSSWIGKCNQTITNRVIRNIKRYGVCTRTKFLQTNRVTWTLNELFIAVFGYEMIPVYDTVGIANMLCVCVFNAVQQKKTKWIVQF